MLTKETKLHATKPYVRPSASASTAAATKMDSVDQYIVHNYGAALCAKNQSSPDSKASRQTNFQALCNDMMATGADPFSPPMRP